MGAKDTRDFSSRDELITRTATIAAIAAGLLYLTWRLVASLSFGTLWLGLPLLVGELWGFSQLMILAFQGWDVRDRRSRSQVSATRTSRSPSSSRPRRSAGRHRAHAAGHRRPTRSARHRRGGSPPPTRGGRSRHELRCRVLHRRRASLRRLLAGRFSRRQRPFAAWVHAGHIPMPHFLERTFGAFEDASVAVVQSAFGMLNKDSLVHVRHGRDEEAFERSVVGPAISRQGSGILVGQRIDGPGPGLEDGRWTRCR